MSEKRRDKKGRILRDGEYQRSDGRYRYRYIDAEGAEHSVYSWRLDVNDAAPRGKQSELSLREMEKQIKTELVGRKISKSGNYTVLELVRKYLSLKIGVRPTTKAGYGTVIKLLENDSFGAERICSVHTSDAKLWLVNLQRKGGKKYSSIHNIRGVLRPAFQMAVDDDILIKNPFQFELATVLVNDSVTREAVTRKQERDFLKFIREDRHFSRYYDAIFILFNTGLRISEFCGLTMRDLEFSEHRIKVDHQLLRTNNMEYIVQPPKTEKGERYVPMSVNVNEYLSQVGINI